MTVVAVGVAAVGAGVAAYGASEQSAANKKAGQAQQAAYAQQQAALNQARNQARSDLQPYATSGTNALNELNWQLGLPDYTSTYKPSAQDVPDTYLAGQTNDPLWEKILANFNASHQARYGIPMNRPWESDADSQAAYGNLVSDYLKQKSQQPTTPYVGQGEKGGLLRPFSTQDYQNDAGYTPFVNTLEDLQKTPGYQFRLNQGLQSVNNSAAARGSLLSGNQLKDLNNYASDFASTEYQNAWSRAQNAYNAAFNRSQTNKQNTFNMLNTTRASGQSAAAGQASASLETAKALAGAAGANGQIMGDLAQNQGQINANMAAGIGNSIIGGLAMGYGGGGYIPSTGTGTTLNGNAGQGNIVGALNNFANQKLNSYGTGASRYYGL